MILYRDHQKELEQFKDMISPSLQKEVNLFIFGDIVKMDSLISDCTERSFFPEDYIMKQGEDPDNLYFLYKGECEVMVKNEENSEESVAILHPGDMFGEIALISNCKRTASVRCLNYNTCATIDQTKFREMCRHNPDIVEEFKIKRSKYNDKWKKFLRSLINSTEYFSRLSFMCKEELLYSLTPEFYEEGQVLFENGDSIDKLYYVSEGEISVLLQLGKLFFSINYYRSKQGIRR